MIHFSKLFLSLGITYWTEGKNVQNGWTNIRCPYCGDKSNHGGFNNESGKYHCWRCGSHHTDETVSLSGRITTSQARKLLHEHTWQGMLQKKLNRKKVAKLPFNFKSKLPPMAKKYLKSRNFNPAYLQEKYDIRFGGIAGDWKYRIIIPIIFDGVVVSWQGRDITGNSDLRYKTLGVEKSIVNPKHCLFNIDNIISSTILVMEGPFDVMRFGDGAVSTLSTTITNEQILKLKIFEKVVFVFDKEHHAQQKARSNAIKLSALGVETELLTIDADDPAELSDEQILEIKNIYF